MSFHFPDQYRITTGPWRTWRAKHGDNGAAWIPSPNVRERCPLKVIASDGAGAAEAGLTPWEHVSVSLPHRCPTWEEMCTVKGLFWDDEDAVLQLHPPRSQWVNNHDFCLHLWRPLDAAVPLPDPLMVGVKELGVLPRERGT